MAVDLERMRAVAAKVDLERRLVRRLLIDCLTN
jgi:hypothetical protein